MPSLHYEASQPQGSPCSHAGSDGKSYSPSLDPCVVIMFFTDVIQPPVIYWKKMWLGENIITKQ